MIAQDAVATMRRGEARLADLAARLKSEDLEKECYTGGWKVHDTLCHVSTHGQSMLHWLKQAGLPAEPDGELTALRRKYGGPAGFDLHGFNDAVVAARRSLSIAELAALLRRDHDRVESVLATLTPADLERSLPNAPWPTTGAALAHLGQAENGHLDDVEAALGARG